MVVRHGVKTLSHTTHPTRKEETVANIRALEEARKCYTITYR